MDLPIQLPAAGGISRDLTRVAWGREHRERSTWGGRVLCSTRMGRIEREVTSDARPRHIPKVAASMGCFPNWDASSTFSPSHHRLEIPHFLWPCSSPGIPKSKRFSPLPRGFSLAADSTNSSPQQVSEVRSDVLPLAQGKEPSRAAAGEPGAIRTQWPPSLHAARGVGSPYQAPRHPSGARPPPRPQLQPQTTPQ